jgi:hypothetical protein
MLRAVQHPPNLKHQQLKSQLRQLIPGQSGAERCVVADIERIGSGNIKTTQNSSGFYIHTNYFFGALAYRR